MLHHYVGHFPDSLLFHGGFELLLERRGDDGDCWNASLLQVELVNYQP